MIGVSGFQFATDRGNTTSAGRNLSPGVVKLPLTNERRGGERDAAGVWLKPANNKQDFRGPWWLFVVEIRASFFSWREFDRALRNTMAVMSDTDEWYVRRLKCILLAAGLWIFMRSWEIEERKNCIKDAWYTKLCRMFEAEQTKLFLSIKIWIFYLWYYNKLQ